MVRFARPEAAATTARVRGPEAGLQIDVGRIGVARGPCGHTPDHEADPPLAGRRQRRKALSVSDYILCKPGNLAAS